ncbi:MAG TPA: chemotaxis protein CheX [Thermotogota bacterium]|nr:chemotaxis protein CheX [Thermotogota bacterium]HRW34653.1 chemotaxis protein CheX [Thermotogota bacterium]
MDVKVINAMLKSLVKVFNETIHSKVELDKPEISKILAKGYDLVTVVGYNGYMEGNLVYGFTSELGLNIVSRMMGMPYEKLDDLAMSAIGELGNMVSGNIAMNLEKIGKPIDITPPSVILGKEIHINVDGLILKIPAHLENFAFEVNMVMRE